MRAPNAVLVDAELSGFGLVSDGYDEDFYVIGSPTNRQLELSLYAPDVDMPVVRFKLLDIAGNELDAGYNVGFEPTLASLQLDETGIGIIRVFSTQLPDQAIPYQVKLSIPDSAELFLVNVAPVEGGSASAEGQNFVFSGTSFSVEFFLRLDSIYPV